MPVIALVRPHPWCTVTAATRPLIRAKASAMVAAPHSCRAATNRAPAATMAFVTWKLPEPTTPKTWSTPSSTRVAPTVSATITRSPLDEREHPGRRARSGHDPQRTGEHDGAGRRQHGEVLQLCQAVLVVAHQVGVAGERR